MFRTLKKRGRKALTSYRAVPLPAGFMDELDLVYHLLGRGKSNPKTRLGERSRPTAWRRVKGVMEAAGIEGTHASPKRLMAHAHCTSRFSPHASYRLGANFTGKGLPLHRDRYFSKIVGIVDQIDEERVTVRLNAQEPVGVKVIRCISEKLFTSVPICGPGVEQGRRVRIRLGPGGRSESG